MVSVAIVGLGGRGGCYANFQNLNPNLMKIVAIADVKKSLLEKYKTKQKIFRLAILGSGWYDIFRKGGDFHEKICYIVWEKD